MSFPPSQCHIELEGNALVAVDAPLGGPMSTSIFPDEASCFPQWVRYLHSERPLTRWPVTVGWGVVKDGHYRSLMQTSLSMLHVAEPHMLSLLEQSEDVRTHQPSTITRPTDWASANCIMHLSKKKVWDNKNCEGVKLCKLVSSTEFKKKKKGNCETFFLKIAS